MTSPSFRYFKNFRLELYGWVKSLYHDKKPNILILLQTLKEELIWRSAFTSLCITIDINKSMILVTGGILFYFIHWSAKKRIVVLTEVELLCFSMLTYFVYLELDTFMGAWAIHFIRNSFLHYHRDGDVVKT